MSEPMSRPKLIMQRVPIALLAIIVMLGLAPAGLAQAAPHERGRQSTADSTAMARARVAADVLMQSYDPGKAWFPSSWWNSAVALQTIGDYMERTGDRRYLDQLDQTFEQNKGAFPAGELSGDEIYGNFTSRAIDDSGWWALNWIQAYDLTGKQKYLDMAVTIAEFMDQFWDTSTCGGGIWWNEERTYKNAVTNGQWIRLTAELHNRIPGDSKWLQRAQQGWDWYVGSGMINSDGLVNDGLNDDCSNNGQTVWTYNQGLGIGAAVELWRATGDQELLTAARRLADAGIADGGLAVDGVLTEACDAPDQTCDDNGKQFKGIFMRYLMDLADTTGDQRYASFVQHQAATIWEHDRDVADRLGTRWAGGSTDDHPNVFDWRTQASALSALIAAVDGPAAVSLSATSSPARPVVMPAAGAESELEFDLGVAATATRTRKLDVSITINAPDGWTAIPQRKGLRLVADGNREPAETTIPVQVTAPAGVADGRYLITSTVTAKPGLTFSTQVEVLIASTIDFDTGTAAEIPWLYDADGSGNNGVQNRFADGNAYFVYRFPFPSDASAATATLTLDNQYDVALSSDGENYTSVLTETEHITDGSNKAEHTIDLTDHLGSEKTVYLKVSDSFPEDGWGGRLLHLSADYSTD